VAMRYEPRR